MSTHDPMETLLQIEGQSVSLIDVAYGDELVLGFGAVNETTTRIGPLKRAQWMFHARETPWIVDTSRGVVATSRHALNEKRLRVLRAALNDSSVAKTVIRNELLALTIVFSNNASLALTPTHDTKLHRPVWILTTPKEYVLLAVPDSGLRLEAGELPFGAVPLHRQDRPRAAGSSASAGEQIEGADPRIGTHFDEHRLLALLETIAALADAEVFQPTQAHGSHVDALIVTSSGKAVIIEVKTSRRALEAPSLSLPRLVIAIGPITKQDKALEQFPGRTRIVELDRIYERELANLVRELAEAA